MSASTPRGETVMAHLGHGSCIKTTYEKRCAPRDNQGKRGYSMICAVTVGNKLTC